jgi:hypothetical protein
MKKIKKKGGKVLKINLNIEGLWGAEPAGYFELSGRKITESSLTSSLGFPESWNNLYGI